MPTAVRVPATQAYREFSELLRRVGDRNDEIVIERYRKPVARVSRASNSPTRWCDLVRAVRRAGRPDKFLEADLFALRGRQVPRETGRWGAVSNTALLDTSVLAKVGDLGGINARQRIALSTAGVAELLAIAEVRGPVFAAKRRRYVEILVLSAPCVSFDAIAAGQFRVRSGPVLPGGSDGPQGRGSAAVDFVPFIAATAIALDWPVLTSDPGAFEGLDAVLIAT